MEYSLGLGIQILLQIQLIALPLASASLHSAHVRSPCLLLQNLPPVNVDLNWMFAPRDPMYVPLGSQHLYRSYAEYFRGHSAADQSDLDNMNLRIALSPLVINNTAYGEYFEQVCLPVAPNASEPTDESKQKPFTFTCVPTKQSPNTDTSLISTTDDTLVWTDNASVLMITRCVKGKYGDWKVLSMTPDISETARQGILAKAIELGLDMRGCDILEKHKSEL